MAAKSKLEILLGLKDNASKKLGRVKSNVLDTATAVRNAGAIMAGAGVGIGLFANKFVTAASKVEDFEVRLISMLGSQKKASEAMKFFTDIASKVPFSIDQVIESGVALNAFGAAHEAWLPVLSDVAAFMGVSLPHAASALGRAYAGGAGAADVFRERGILQVVRDFKGIQDLSKLTLPEFRKAMFDAFTSDTGKIAGAAELLSKTWTGQLSMLGDSIFRYLRSAAILATYCYRN
jgi:phage tail tape-measure protein